VQLLVDNRNCETLHLVGCALRIIRGSLPEDKMVCVCIYIYNTEICMRDVAEAFIKNGMLKKCVTYKM